MLLIRLVHGLTEGRTPEVFPNVAGGFNEGAQGDDMLRGAQAPAHAPVAHAVLNSALVNLYQFACWLPKPCHG